ncbi:thioesterase domain-containing protein [Streptomyces sp. NPDC005423]|uniref:thioesterase II family protein n=1 Tax=Streptomyces sp. NPDC005423 TaxID=3155343 RepID=UPI0033BF58A1
MESLSSAGPAGPAGPLAAAAASAAAVARDGGGRPGTRTGRERGLRLYVFPHAGGSGLMFQDFAGRLPGHWDIRPQDAPGHGAGLGQPLISEGPLLVEHFLDRLSPQLASEQSPFAFFGHSMGALVAYELTRRLIARGGPLPVWLGLSACGAPSDGAPPDPVSLRGVGDTELRRRLALLGGTPPQVLDHPGLWSLFAPVIRADLELVANWHPAPPGTPLPVPVSVFAGEQDHAAPPHALAHWAAHCARFLGLRVFTGGHFYFREDPQPVALAAIADIRRALREHSGGPVPA